MADRVALTVLAILVLCAALSGCVSQPQRPVFAYPGSNDVVGTASTFEQARAMCETEMGTSLVQTRLVGSENLGWECLPTT